MRPAVIYLFGQNYSIPVWSQLRFGAHIVTPPLYLQMYSQLEMADAMGALMSVPPAALEIAFKRLEVGNLLITMALYHGCIISWLCWESPLLTAHCQRLMSAHCLLMIGRGRHHQRCQPLRDIPPCQQEATSRAGCCKERAGSCTQRHTWQGQQG